MKSKILMLAAALGALALPACDWMPGKPTEADKWQNPVDVVDFKQLFHENCLGCHGDGHNVGAVLSLNDPLYLSITTPERVKEIITSGIKGAPMPAFAVENGGKLTDKQIGILVEGIFAWGKGATPPADAPPYEAPLGDPAAGASAFSVSCASCHGVDGKGVAGKAGSVVDINYLGLVTNQYLRTITIVGRPELGCPDFAHRVPGRVMNAQEVSDITAWLVSQRRGEFDQPISPTATPAAP